MKNYGIILASGTGARFKSEIPKQFTKIYGKTILEHTINVFENSNCIDSIIVVITPEYKDYTEKIVSINKYKKVESIVKGGKTRKESSYIGICSVKEDEANVFIHDCARPFLSGKILKKCKDALTNYKAVLTAIPSTDTIVEVKNNIVENIPQRQFLYCAQTPQCFKLSLIKKAHELAKNDDNFTDDCGLISKYNLAEIYVVQGDINNIKITYPKDIYLAENCYNSLKM